MRSFIGHVALALALAAPAAAQDRAQERRSLGADSLFGPGIVDFSANGNAAKLRLTRPAHVVVVALREPAVAQLVLPRREETRITRAGDTWVDLPWSVFTGGDRVMFAVARVEVTTRGVPAGAPVLPPSVPAPRAGAGAGAPVSTVVLVIASDSAWSREAIVRLLPQEPPAGLMALAHNLATALVGGRADTCAAYLVRW